MRITIYIFLATLFLSTVVGAQSKGYEKVAFCDLARQPDKYRGETVELTAIYRFGSEWSELYCFECVDTPRIWVDFDDAAGRSAEKKFGSNGVIGRTVKVVLIGRLEDGGYGHMGAYRYRLLVTKVMKAKILSNSSPSPHALPEKLLKKLDCT